MQMTDEQRKVIEERLKNMSPEEIQALQAQQCIFCQITQGKIPTKTIFEDDLVKVILDINPASPGHCLIIPKQHFMVLPQVPKPLVEHMALIAKRISLTILRSMKVDGTSWFAANGAIAGQRANHVMMHIIPRADGDGVGLTLPSATLDAQNTEVLTTTLGPVIGQILSGEIPQLSESPPPPQKSPEIPAPPEPAHQQQPPDEPPKKPDDDPETSLENGQEEQHNHTRKKKDEDPPKKEGGKKASLDDIADFLAKK